MKIFSGTSNLYFAKKVSEHINLPLGIIDVGTYKDGECSVVIKENIRNQTCIIIQTTCSSDNKSVNDYIMELLIMIDALKRGSASKIVVVMPYYGYSRSDRKDYSRAPISANVVAKCLEAVNVNRIIVYELHASQIVGFFSNNCPIDNLYNDSYFVKYINEYIIKDKNKDDIIIVSPDEGGVKKATVISNKINCEIATIYKQRNAPNEVKLMKLIGEVKGKIAILIDDMIDTGNTACKAAKLLKDYGAIEVHFIASHGIFSNNAVDLFEQSDFSSVIVTNTIYPKNIVKKSNKIKILDVSWLCAEAIIRQETGNSLSELYTNKKILEENNIKLEFVN